MTNAEGVVRIGPLPAGDYWLDVSYLGINTAYHCFHVAQRPTRNAKRRMRYDWGDSAPATKRLAGSLLDWQPGKERNAIQNLIQRVKVPIAGATISLQNPITGHVSKTISDQDGSFAFDQAPTGIYVLRIFGGTGRPYEPTNLLIRISTGANRDRLELVRHEAGAGDCDGSSIKLRNYSPSPVR